MVQEVEESFSNRLLVRFPTPPYKIQTNNKADCCQFFIAQTTHCNTHVLYMEATQDTHTHTRRPEVAVNSTSAFNPSRIVPPPGSSRSSGQLLSARGPIEPSVSVRDGQECSVLFASKITYNPFAKVDNTTLGFSPVFLTR